ncbi:tetraspanin-3-like [Pelobates fuscus]|uniref:tetraspanin-3-like n=1 Tax=Pelobates fuscus TaxID=191477 RepID=UPI002FE4342B
MGRYGEIISTVFVRSFAFLFWAAAVAILYAVFFLLSAYRHYKLFFHDFHILLPCGFVIAGAGILLINGCLGCKISHKDSRCKQGCFMYFIIVLLCLEATGVVLAHININRMDYELQPMKRAFKHYNDSKVEADTTVNNIQKELKCCGLYNYTDWKATDWYKQSGSYRVPETCCDLGFPACTGNITESYKLYHEGCSLKLHKRLNFYLTWLFWACIALIGVEILAAICDGVLMVRNPFRDFRILDSGAFA